MIFNQKYIVLEELGKGLTANVYKIECVKTKQLFALKVIKLKYLQKRPSNTAEILKEIQLTQMMNHKNIIRMVDSGTRGSTSCGKTNLVYMILEYVPNAVMFDLVKRNGQLGEDAARFFLKQFLAALEYMHQKKGVVHRDIKMENILITGDLQVKFADFGFATRNNIDALVSRKGTKTYMAPEMKIGQTYHGKHVDIFSLGVIVFILAQGIYPFQEATSTDPYFQMIISGNLDQYWETIQGQDLSPAFKDFILKFFTFNGNDRITLEEIKKHPWYKQENDSDYRIKRKIVRRFEQMGGQKGTFKIIKEKSINDKVGQKIGFIKFQKESKHEGDAGLLNSYDPEHPETRISKKNATSKIIEIEVEDVDFEILQVDEAAAHVVENEKYRYDKKSRICVKRVNSQEQQPSRSNWKSNLVRPITKVYNYLTARS